MNTYGMELNPTTVKNPTVNMIVEIIQINSGYMLCTSVFICLHCQDENTTLFQAIYWSIRSILYTRDGYLHTKSLHILYDYKSKIWCHLGINQGNKRFTLHQDNMQKKGIIQGL